MKSDMQSRRVLSIMFLDDILVDVKGFFSFRAELAHFTKEIE